MKQKGAIMEFSNERLSDLFRAYNEYALSCDCIRIADIYKDIVNMPSKRFWVSDVRASIVVSAMIRGEADLNAMWTTKKEMYLEIYSRVMQLKKEFPDLSVYELCSFVVKQPAPKFYLSAGSAKVMIYKARKKWRTEKRQKLYASYVG